MLLRQCREKPSLLSTSYIYLHRAATMDTIDRDMEKAEVAATRTWSQRSSAERHRSYEEIDRRGTRDSESSSTSGSSTSIRERASTRTGTQSLTRIKTHPIEMHRTETHRLQHSHTVGTNKSRSSAKPLPNFGGGKPYPPALPEQDEYVVEFDGPHDPLHPQNWPLKRK